MTHRHHADGEAWAQHATGVLRGDGRRSGGARSAVVEQLAREDCCLSAQDLHDRLRGDGRGVGIASIYRSLELLQAHGLVSRIELGAEAARFERADPAGHHHHHAVCTRCGAVEAFEDPGLEAALDALAARLDFEVSSHDVALHGLCPRCRRA